MSQESTIQLPYRVIFHSMIVLGIGLIAGLMLAFSLLEAVNLWPLPTWEVAIPGSTRGWKAAHIGGIMNGTMMVAFAFLMMKLDLSPTQTRLTGWGLIVTGWGNTLFYWAGNIAPNRGLSAADTLFGPADLAGILSFFGGGIAMFLTFMVIYILGRAALNQANLKAV